jgi:hypothetical protein
VENNGHTNQIDELDYSQGFNQDNFTDYCCKQIKKSLEDHAPFFAFMDKMYNSWRSILEEKIFPWAGCANTSPEMASTTVDGIVPRVIEGCLDFDTPLQVKAHNSTSDTFSDTIRAFVNWDLASHPEIYKAVWLAAQNAGWSGTGFLKSYFFKQRATQSRWIKALIVDGKVAEDPNTVDPKIPNSGEPLEANRQNVETLIKAGINPEIKKTKRKDFSWKKYGPGVKALDIKDVLQPVGTTDLQEAFEKSWVASRVHYTKDELRRMCKEDDKGLFDKLDWDKIKEFSNKVDAETATGSDGKRAERDMARSKSIEFWEMHVKYDIDDDELEEQVVALIHLPSKQMVGFEEFPFEHGRCPIVPLWVHPLANSIYGIGFPEKLRGLEVVSKAEQDQRIDRNSLYNSPPLTITEAAGFDSRLHKPGPGRKWLMKNIGEDVMKYMYPPHRTESFSFEEQQMLDARAQKRCGLTDFSLGSEGSVAQNKTATGIQAVIAEGNVGFRNYIRWFSLGLGEFFTQRLSLYAQYWGEADDPEVLVWIQKILDVPGNPLKAIGVEGLRQKFDIVLTAFKQDKKLELQKATARHQMAMEDPNIQQSPKHLRKITLAVWRAMGVQNPEEDYPTEEEIQAQQVAIQKQAMQEMEAEKAEQNIREAEGKGYIEGKAEIKARGGGE